MLEQKDFINVESHYNNALRKIKSQLKRGDISFEEASYKTRIELLSLKHKLPLLSIMLPKEEYLRLEKLVKSYEKFIDLSKSKETSL